MSEIQHAGACKLLKVIATLPHGKSLPSYEKAAELIGRPEKDARAVAQMCDLLDAAACLSGTPLLALVKVLAKSGEINPKAFKENVELRESILKKSLAYRFKKADYSAISLGLTKLENKGNRLAWEYVYKLFSQEQLVCRLTRSGPIDDPALNAIDDIGTDTPDRALSQVWVYTRNQAVRDAVLNRAKGICEFCGKTGFVKSDGKPYLESHHVIALASQGEDRTTNVIALCPNDHREAHFGARRKEIEDEMIQILKRLHNNYESDNT